MELDLKEVTPESELTLDAALELAELRTGLRQDIPSFECLIDLIRDDRPLKQPQGVTLLSDPRGFSVVRNAWVRSSKAGQPINLNNFREIVVGYLNGLKQSALDGSAADTKTAEEFCLALNKAFLSRKYSSVEERAYRSKNLQG
ncbi:hypothetical protein [Terrarubrum flagellatum]|uniref:hypothetical protein n=1 Tax=Terrirubrum flagellatum TaxID=2895980 RepID=UPI00314550DF